jgi:hypothetical protein
MVTLRCRNIIRGLIPQPDIMKSVVSVFLYFPALLLVYLFLIFIACKHLLSDN